MVTSCYHNVLVVRHVYVCDVRMLLLPYDVFMVYHSCDMLIIIGFHCMLTIRVPGLQQSFHDTVFWCKILRLLETFETCMQENC